MKMNKCLGIALLLVLVVSCSQVTDDKISISTISWANDANGYLQFKTNDAAMLNTTNWNWTDNTNQASFALPVTVNIIKKSGAANFGAGLLFCIGDNNNFYDFLYNTQGYYVVEKRVSGTFSYVVPWTYSAYINKEQGAINKLSVSQSSPGNFALSINDNPSIYFTDSSFSSGSCGLWAAIGGSNEEKFPNIPVDVRFQMTSPIQRP